MVKISEDQLRLAKKMRAEGSSWKDIADATGASVRGLTYNAKRNGWNLKSIAKPAPKRAKPIAKLEQKSIEQIAELVRDQLANDIEASANTLRNWQSDSLDLRDWQKREQIAESIQKRASSLLNIGNQAENVVNIAVLSQLPEAASSSAIDG
jgi:hypothetical protein